MASPLVLQYSLKTDSSNPRPPKIPLNIGLWILFQRNRFAILKSTLGLPNTGYYTGTQSHSCINEPEINIRDGHTSIPTKGEAQNEAVTHEEAWPQENDATGFRAPAVTVCSPPLLCK